jgi:penicillin-binding protein 1A
LSDWNFRNGSKKRAVDWLALDSLIDSSLFGIWETIKDRWANLTAFNQRFNLYGPLRVCNELLSEVVSLGVVGFGLLLGFALPAFDAVAKGDPLAYSRYSFQFLDEDGNELGRRGILRNDAVALEEMPDAFIKSLLATEDRRFFDHYGIDVIGTMRALYEDVKQADARQGGSSLTQQLAKNAFLSSEKSLQRKMKEAFLALWLEQHYSKHDILKLYLERAYMGGGAFGAEAGAQFYFGKSIRNVSLAEAAMLAGLFKAPTKYAPHIYLAAARKRADEVLSNLVEAGFMTESQVHEARLHPATPVISPRAESPDWFLDYAYEEGQRLMQGRQGTVLKARVTVDLNMQRIGEETVRNAIRDYGPGWGAKQSALVSMEADGAIRALVGGVDYGESNYNRAFQSKRQPGSSFKPYVYLTAIQELGYTTETRVSDGGYVCSNGHVVKNDAAAQGMPPLSYALAVSANNVAVRLSDVVTRKKVNETLAKLHVTRQTESCTMALGDGGVTVAEHVGGYATFLNGGKNARRYAIIDIRNSRGELVYSHDRDEPPPEQVFSPRSIGFVNQLMRRVITDGTARAADLDFTMAVGKTGTTSSHRDAWFMGLTGKYVTGIWIGNDDNRVMHGVFGGQSAAPMWKTFNTAVHTSPNIPQLEGMPLNANQIVAMQQQAATQTADSAQARKKDGSLDDLPESMKSILKQVEDALRQAGTQASTAEPGRKAALDPTTGTAVATASGSEPAMATP